MTSQDRRSFEDFLDQLTSAQVVSHIADNTFGPVVAGDSRDGASWT